MNLFSIKELKNWPRLWFFPLRFFHYCRFRLNNAVFWKKAFGNEKREVESHKSRLHLQSTFLASDYNCPPFLTQTVSLRRKYLKYNAVPYIFDFPDHLEKKLAKERNPKRESEVQHWCLDSNLPRAPKTPKLDHTYPTG